MVVQHVVEVQLEAEPIAAALQLIAHSGVLEILVVPVVIKLQVTGDRQLLHVLASRPQKGGDIRRVGGDGFALVFTFHQAQLSFEGRDPCLQIFVGGISDAGIRAAEAAGGKRQEDDPYGCANKSD